MTDHLEKLRATVRELEQELAEVQSLDPESRILLEEAAREIAAALHINEPATLSTQPLMGQLQTTATSFEVSHPTLAGVVRRVISALAQWGI